jgi:hypothetical protein
MRQNRKEELNKDANWTNVTAVSPFLMSDQIGICVSDVGSHEARFATEMSYKESPITASCQVT